MRVVRQHDTLLSGSDFGFKNTLRFCIVPRVLRALQSADVYGLVFTILESMKSCDPPINASVTWARRLSLTRAGPKSRMTSSRIAADRGWWAILSGASVLSRPN